MDIQALKTFLTLAEVQRLSLCAEQLCLTKSAVSSRVRQLEQQLGEQLFVRNARGMQLTDAGRSFYRHAMVMHQRWIRAKLEIRDKSSRARWLRLGAHTALANDLLLSWSSAIRARYPELGLHLEADYSNEIVRQVAQGTLDIGLIFVADTTSGLVVEQVLEDKLIMVSSDARALEQVHVDRYLYLDWGWGYNAAHNERLPQLQSSLLSCGKADLGLPWLLQNGGTAYLPARTVASQLASGLLVQVADAPEFKRPIFATFAADAPDRALLDTAREVLAALGS
ncbi:LysR family transcriptional regulator [Zobellella maritima]|uniref:LysR family transcriptional regulator n=1 Tax=Zobellella maritima TaxID=2059725 RepID=UPI000E305A0D|nr:LysR family transcriptional regulator [Zobellella maritima]